MDEKLAFGILAALGGTGLTAALAGIGTLISMRLKIAVLEEKQKYHSGQIRSLLRRAKLLTTNEVTGEISTED